MLSTRPPPPLSSSMEVIPKRYRSGSISSRLRSASELLDEGVIENRQQKGLLKDLIISGDEALADALTRYERGDKEPIKNLLREGVLNRKSSLDLLGDVGDLSFDFLSVSATSKAFDVNAKNNLDAPFPMDEEELTFEILLQESSDAFGKSPPKRLLNHGSSFTLGRSQMGHRSSSLSSIPAGSLGNANNKSGLGSSKLNISQNSIGGIGTFSSLGTPPPDLFEISILDETGVGAWAHPALRGGTFSSRKEVLDFDSDDLESPPGSPKRNSATALPPTAPRSASGSHAKSRRSNGTKTSGAGASAGKQELETTATSAPIVIPRPAKSSGAGRAQAASSTKRTAAATEKAKEPTPAPTLTTEERAASRRAAGVPMVGAYSPESRRIRVERFVAKRDRRVWKKKVKYDVRKNFADSRLRVKGRFVKKEDEEMLRDLMTMV